jgi:RNA-directed DNA polymerase
MNAGDLSGKDAVTRPVEVRDAIVALKSGNADGAKGVRKANSLGERSREGTPPVVPATDTQGGEDLWQRYKAERGVWSQGMLEALARGVKGGKWFSLIDKLYADRTLALGWQKVKSNAGSCGVDNITVSRFAQQAEVRLLAVKEHLREARYQPQPIKRVWIPKPGSREKRPLGIPTVRDRVVQASLRMVIEPIFEHEFAPQSYGFRPGRSCKDALRQVDGLLKSGSTYVVDVDFKGFFDSIPHDHLLARVEEHVADGRVLGLIKDFLKVGIMEEGKHWSVEEGTPQGGVISPLLANIYLNPLDWQMKNRGVEMVRYADDIVILCPDLQSAQQALGDVQKWAGENGLTLHPEKTRVVDMTISGSYFDFLGYRFWKSRKGNIRRLVRPKSMRKLRQTIKPLTRRANGHSMAALTKKLTPILRGWHNYFKQADLAKLREVDGWVRGRLRGILRKRSGLRGLSRGADHQRWPNTYFAALGLFCLEEAHRAELTSLRNGATC